jgi:hypothetical protein
MPSSIFMRGGAPTGHRRFAWKYDIFIRFPVGTHIALPHCKKRGSRADLRDEAHSFLLKIRSGCQPWRSSPPAALSEFALACVLPGLGALLLICGSEFGATAHDGAHDASSLY